MRAFKLLRSCCRLRVGFALVGSALACNSASPTTASSNPDVYARRKADGTYDLYSGPGVADLIQRGRIVAKDDQFSYFKLGDVPARLVESAHARATGVVSISLEDPNAPPVTVFVSFRRTAGAPTTVSVKPGDPWVSGIAQVWIDEGGAPIGLFELAILHRSPNGALSKDVYTTGLRADPDLPLLKYNLANRSTALPASWH
jgi:hypothetical protein